MTTTEYRKENMREIKFRAWDKENKTMLLDIGIHINRMIFITRQGHDRPYTDDFEIMQYTGLKDKNDKEIYEGDVCKRIWADDDYMIFKVCFSEGRFAEWWNGMDVGKIADGSVMRDGKVEVIGNIYENPELIKEK